MSSTSLGDDRPDARVKDFYSGFHDRIAAKRHASPYWLRRYVHRSIHAQFLPHVEPGERVLDAGCGDGMLACALAEHGAEVTGVDLSVPNIEAARAMAVERGIGVRFEVGDTEALSFDDDTFDVVVSSHVLEHLPDPVRGARELRRVCRDRALVAMPTCFNPAAWALLGGDAYWRPGIRSLFGVPVGLARVLGALVRGAEGPDEGYVGKRELPHVWRFPWAMKRVLTRAGFTVEAVEAGPLVLPYLPEAALPLQRRLDGLRRAPVLRTMGFGTLMVCRKPGGAR